MDMVTDILKHTEEQNTSLLWVYGFRKAKSSLFQAFYVGDDAFQSLQQCRKYWSFPE